MKAIGQFLFYISSIPTFLCIYIPILTLLNPGPSNLFATLLFMAITVLAAVLSSFVAFLQVSLMATLLPRRAAKALGVDFISWRRKL